jgi:pimeloyl-ACP methyl ester carboxylesterase
MYSDDDLRDYFKVMAPLYSLKTPLNNANKENNEAEFHAAKKNVRYNYEAALAGFGPDGFLHSFDWRPQLSEVKCPVKIVVGDKDWINDKAHAFEVQKLYNSCSVKVIPDSGHFVWVDQKEAYFETMSNFITEILS